jgi:hypothetical protein
VENCTLVGKKSLVSYQGKNETEEITLEFACMETDPYWGGFTISFMAIPGVLVWILFSLRQRISSCIQSLKQINKQQF